MPFTAEQQSYTSYPGPPARYFLMDAARMGAPMQALHRLALFSTSVSGYRAYGPYHRAQHGEARWDTGGGPEGEFAYGELELLDIRFE